MQMQTMAFWLTLGEGVVLLWMFLAMPVMGGARAFFGVRVDDETLGGSGAAVLRRYRLTLSGIIIAVQACGYLVAVRTNSVFPALLASLVTIAAGMLVYNKFAREVRPLARIPTQTRFASSLRARSLSDYTHLLTEAFVLLVTVLPFVLLAYFYAALPDPIPVHWNARGEADGWAAKTAATVFFPSVLVLYLQVWFLVLKYDLAGAKLTLPAEHTEEYLQGKERFLLANMRVVDVARVSVGWLFLTISLLLIATAVPSYKMWQPIVNASIWIGLAAMLGGIFYFISRASRINKKLQERFGDWYVQRPADEAHWQGGGLGYSNMDDPALMVEKLVGIGYTYNTAHPAFRTRLALLAGVPLFVLWAVIGM